MKTTKLLLIVLFGIILTSCSKEDEGIYFNKLNISKTSYSPVESKILILINEYRELKNLKPLERCNIISTVALSHSQFMAKTNSLNHDNFLDRRNLLISKAKAKNVGENVGFGYKVANKVVEAWIKSDSHRELIENSNFTHFGISIEKNLNGINYFTNMFVKK